MKRRKPNQNELPLLGHLKELRKVLLVIAYAVAAGALVGWFLTPYVLEFVEWPILHLQKNGVQQDMQKNGDRQGGAPEDAPLRDAIPKGIPVDIMDSNSNQIVYHKVILVDNNKGTVDIVDADSGQVLQERVNLASQKTVDIMDPDNGQVLREKVSLTNPEKPVVSIQNLKPTELLMVKLKLSMVIGVFVTVPIIFWQLWSFLLPALKRSEKRYVYKAVPWSVILFLGGAAFCFFVILPLCLDFFVSLNQEGMGSDNNWTVNDYVNFVLRFVLSFGMFAELPVVLLALMGWGVLSPQVLAKYRKYALFIIILAAVIIAPTPDLATLGFMIVPVYALYEVSIWIGKVMVKRKARRESRADEKEEVSVYGNDG